MPNHVMLYIIIYYKLLPVICAACVSLLHCFWDWWVCICIKNNQPSSMREGRRLSQAFPHRSCQVVKDFAPTGYEARHLVQHIFQQVQDFAVVAPQFIHRRRHHRHYVVQIVTVERRRIGQSGKLRFISSGDITRIFEFEGAAKKAPQLCGEAPLPGE